MALATLIGLTFVPGLELRASIPVGFFTPGIRETLSLPAIIGVCLVAVALLCVLIDQGAVAEGSWIRRLFLKMNPGHTAL
jgi:hypothetical protein